MTPKITIKQKPALHKKFFLFWLLILIMLLGIIIFPLRGQGFFFFGRSNTIRLVEMKPAGEIDLRTNLTFVFSADVADQSEVGKTIDLPLVELTPEIPGRFRWVSRKELLFLPEMPFRPSTTYTAEINPDLLIKENQNFSGSRSVKFFTTRLKVESATINLKPPQPLTPGFIVETRLTFNHPVDREELIKNLQIRVEGSRRAIDYHLQAEHNNRVFLLLSEPLTPGDREQTIELILPRGFRGVEGDLGLAEEFKVSKVRGAKKPLAVTGAAPQQDSASFWVALHFSQPPEMESLENFLRVRPEVTYRLEAAGNTVLLKSNDFKPNTRYTVSVLAGLPALNGYPLAHDFSQVVSFGDLVPSLNFNSPGRYLSSRGHLNLGLETVNVDRVNLEIRRIYLNNLVPFLNNSNYHSSYSQNYISHVGEVVHSKIIEVKGAKNEVVTTPVALGEYLAFERRGFFQVVAYDDDYYWRRDIKYVVVTDLGIVAKMSGDDLVVWVNSLSDLTPRARARVTLLSKNNQPMAAATTDHQGLAVIKNLRRLREQFEPFVVLAEDGEDFSFLQLSAGLLSVADFDTRGRPTLEEGYETFIYLDRDLFRPGDTANLVTVVRGPRVSLPPEFPFRLEIRQPDGQVFRELLGNTREQGICEFALPIPEYAQTGKYVVRALIAEEVTGTATFSVEEFMPDRIKVTVTPDRPDYSPGEEALFTVEGIHLFGPPAAGRRVEAAVTLHAEDFRPTGFASYTFGDRERQFTPLRRELGDKILDEEGRAEFVYQFPRGLTPPSKISAVFQATVTEEGGRAVSAYQVVEFHPYEQYVGIKPLSDGYGEVGKEYAAGYVVVDRTGRPVESKGLVAEVYHITWNTVYRRDAEGRFRYQSEEEKRKVHSEELPDGAGERIFTYTPRDYGRYQIVIREPQENGARASLSFYAGGWGFAPWAMDNPDKVHLSLDKTSYRPGETAQVQIKAPFAGKALVTVEREKILAHQIIDLPENTGLVAIPVHEDYLPNVYVSVHLLSPAGGRERLAPVRAFGTIPLPVDTSARRLPLRLEVPEELRPNTKVKVKIGVPGAGGETRVTLAAVDEGICQLTGYTAPDPMDFFYGKKQLDVAGYDLYAMVLPEVEPAATTKAPAGDADLRDALRKQHLTPVALRRVVPVSLWSGIVTLSPEGEAEITLDLPQFNGTLRFMAAAMSGERFGAVQEKRIVRDPVVLTPTFPRFAAPGDRFTATVSVFNATEEAGEFRLLLTADGPVKITGDAVQTVYLLAGEEKSLVFPLEAAEEAGTARFRLTAGGNNITVEHTEELPVRPPAPFTRRLSTGTVTAENPLVFKLEDDWLPGTEEYSLLLAPFPTIQLAGSLQYLLAYPYGCLEQVTSKLFPLLYFDDLARAAGSEVFKGGNAVAFLAEGIEMIEAMNLRDGSFLYWPGGNYSNRWSSIYAAHFLVEARKAGYSVADRVYDRALSYLKNLTKSNEEGTHALQCRVYALYVLSLAGDPQLSTMTYFKNHQFDLLDEYSRALLAGAYFYAGDRETAWRLLPALISYPRIPRETGGNFNSTVRAEAIILSVLADVDPANHHVPRLVRRLTANRLTSGGYWGTTQENAFALMALGKVMRKRTEGTYEGEILLDGTVLAGFDSSRELTLSDARLGESEVTVKITGEGECYYFLQSSGVPRQLAVPEDDRGIAVRREYLDRHGNPLTPENITQGDLVIAGITLTVREENLENIVITDLLPAGLEIENPRLESRAGLPWLQEEDFPVDYMDIRDDRLLLFTSPRRTGTYRFHYALRAVTCGEFFLPPVKAECIYEPEISSVASSGYLTIKK